MNKRHHSVYEIIENPAQLEEILAENLSSLIKAHIQIQVLTFLSHSN